MKRTDPALATLRQRHIDAALRWHRRRVWIEVAQGLAFPAVPMALVVVLWLLGVWE